MSRYHVKVFTEAEHAKLLKEFTEYLNRLDWKYSRHTLENLQYRAIDLEALLRFIKGIKLDPAQIFEYYKEDGSNLLYKVCYRVPYGAMQDIILILGSEKQLITIYLNASGDNHETLRKNQYKQGV